MRHESIYEISVKALAGAERDNFFKDVIKLVNQLHYNDDNCLAVQTNFNDTPVTIRYGDSLETIIEIWNLKRSIQQGKAS